MANVSNFIPLNRSLQNNWIWNDKEPFDKRSAWIDLIMLANFETKKTPYKGEVIECKRGDVNLSILHLAARWRWSREKTRRFLRMLESDNMIQINATTHRTTITLVNYGFYNDYQPTNKTTDETTDDTTSVQPTRQQADTTNNINNINNGNKENKCASALAPIYEDFCSKLADYYPAERFDKDEAFPLWVEKVKEDDEPQKKSDDIGRVIFNYLKTFTGEERKYIPKLSNVLGKDYVRIVEANLNTDECDDKYADFPPVLRKYLKKHAQKDEV